MSTSGIFAQARELCATQGFASQDWDKICTDWLTFSGPPFRAVSGNAAALAAWN